MKKQTIFRHSYPHQRSESFNFKKRRGAVLALLICLIGLLPIHSFAQALAKGQSKFLGNVISDGNAIRSDFTKYWNQVTAEDAGKWQSVEYSQDVYKWTELDNIYDYAICNSFPYKHHALVWGAINIRIGLHRLIQPAREHR